MECRHGFLVGALRGNQQASHKTAILDLPALAPSCMHAMLWARDVSVVIETIESPFLNQLPIFAGVP